MKVLGNLDTEGGQIVETRQQNYTSLPAFVVGKDEGRIIYVTTGADLGYHMGREDGSNAFRRLNLGTTLAQYDLVNQSINDTVTLQATLLAATLAVQKGLVVENTVTSNLSSGKVLVELFNDSARTQRFFARTIDLADPFTDTFPAFMNVDNAAGDIYANVTNMTGQNGTFTLSLTVAGVLLVQQAAPPGDGSGVNAGVAGDGIVYDAVGAQLGIDLDSDPGLQLLGVAGSRQLSVLTAPSGGLERFTGGLQVDSTVLRTTGDQLAIAGNKTFANGLGMTPAGTAGPPISGTFARGSFYIDINDDVFYCLVGGTPGTWIFWGWRVRSEGGAADGSSYTVAVGPGASANLVIATRGRRGVLRKVNVWGSDSTFGVSNLDTPFALASFRDESFEGRQEFWKVNGQLRKTNFDAAMSAGTAVASVVTVNVGEPGDLVRLRNATPLEEFGRIIIRDTGTTDYTLDENVDNAYALNDVFMLVTEFAQLPFVNTSSVPANFENIYLRFFNEDATATVVFGYELLIESIGGGQPL